MLLSRPSGSISTSSKLFILLSCKLVLALPTELPSHSTEHTSTIETNRTGLVRFGALGLGSLHLVVIAGIVYIIIRFTMPKSVKERRLDREYKVSPREARLGQCSNVLQEKGQIKEKPVQIPGGDINKIWVDAVRKGSGDESGDKQTQDPVIKIEPGTLNPANHSFTLSRTLSHGHPIPPPITFRDNSYNFGENPNYHDEAFHYNPTYQTSSISTPPSPFSSRFYSVNIRKVKGHRRSRSSPLSSRPYQTLQAIGFQSDANPTPQFPLPTLRPITPSTSETPLSASQDQESIDSTTICRYTKQYPQNPQADLSRIRDHSTPPLDRCENVPNTNTGLSIIEGARWSNNTNSIGNDGTFQPVMIFEQGQSVTGQKWKRKVTVFRSDVLEKLEQEGLVLY